MVLGKDLLNALGLDLKLIIGGKGIHERPLAPMAELSSYLSITHTYSYI